MIADIMSESFTVLPGGARAADLVSALEAEPLPAYLVISLAETAFAIVAPDDARSVLRRMGEKLGPALLELPVCCLPGLDQPGQAVDVDESEQVARAAALRSPAKRVLIVSGGVPVGVVKAQVRGALFGAVPSALYGERFDLFEKGTVSPRYPLTCPHCASSFDFYKPTIAEGAVVYRCPSCDGVVEE